MTRISALSDNFDDNSVDLTKWGVFEDADTSLSESSGRLNITIPAGAGSRYAGLYPQDSYDYTNGNATIEVTTLPSRVNTQMYIIMYIPGSRESAKFSYANSKLYFDYYWGASSSSRTSINYDATRDRWWRIRHGSGNINFESSPDGETWTNHKAHPSHFSVTNIMVDIAAGSYGSPTESQTVSFDNFNTYIVVHEAVGSISGGGSATLQMERGSLDITSSISGISRAIYSTKFQALPQKDYEYRVFDSDGNYIATWNNVISDFGYTQSINQTPSEMTVEIARSPDNRIVKLDTLMDESGDPILDENSSAITLSTETPNSVGEDTDIDMNLNVDVYAFYGGYESLQDENGEDILDENSSAILTQFGFPNGKRVYSGYIADYELTYGRNTGVKVLLVPHATEQSHYVFKSGASTTVAYNSADPVTMARDAMNSYGSQGGLITWNEESMPLSGWVSSYDFKLQTIKEVMDKILELLPVGYYHYPDPGDNIQYLLLKSTTADHTFYYEKHISELNLRKSITQLVNKVYFVGGETATGADLFKYYEDAASITNYRPGLERLSDSRVTVASSAQVLSESQINAYKEPRYRTSVKITDAVYDIENIRLGQMVGFKNFGTFVDDLLLQIVTLDKEKHAVTMGLDMVVAGDTKRLAEIKRNILNEQIRNVGSAPS